MMLFTLEALHADEGDCLILHYRKSSEPRIIVIDGGPGRVFEDRLRPRLEELQRTYRDRGWLDSEERLPIEMVMVSHIDNDHIVGILKWTNQIVKRRHDRQPEGYDINTLWHNSFDDILNNDQYGLLAMLQSRVTVGLDGILASYLGLEDEVESEDDLSLILAGVPQGRTLRDNAGKLRLNVNLGFKKLIMAPVKGKKTIDWDDGLTFTVLSPPKDKLANLQDEWDDKVKKLGIEDAGSPSDAHLLELAKYGNLTIPNRASIVVLAELAGRKILLTGDARGDDITAGLNHAGLMKNGTFHVDILKMQHHGSKNNFDETFFEQVTADHYVVSGDGGHGNPHPDVLEQFAKVRGDADCTLWLTNEVVKPYRELIDPNRLTKFRDAQKAAGKKFRMLFRSSDKPSLVVDLLDKLNY